MSFLHFFKGGGGKGREHSATLDGEQTPGLRLKFYPRDPGASHERLARVAGSIKLDRPLPSKYFLGHHRAEEVRDHGGD